MSIARTLSLTFPCKGCVRCTQVLISVSYAVAGMQLFGAWVPQFATLGSALLTCFEMTYGEGVSAQELADLTAENGNSVGADRNVWLNIYPYIYCTCCTPVVITALHLPHTPVRPASMCMPQTLATLWSKASLCSTYSWPSLSLRVRHVAAGAAVSCLCSLAPHTIEQHWIATTHAQTRLSLSA